MSVAIQFTQNFLGAEPECSQVCKFVKEFRPDLLGVCTAGIEVPCKLVEVSAHLAALGKQSGNSGQGFFAAACNDDRFLNLDVVDALYKIGLVLQGQDTSANSGLIEGVRGVLTQERVDLHVFLTDNKFCNERRCLETVVHQNFHGFIVDGVKSSILSPNLDCYKELYRRKIPVIFYNNFYRNLRCPRVTINDIECAHQLIGRLIDAGHSNIAGIFVYDNYQSVEKFQGMAEAMRDSGLELKDDYIKWCISDEAHNESYVRAIEKFLKGIPKCTAIVCCNYIIYRLVIKTLQKMGKTVPKDYSLVCFDYSEETYRQEDVTCSVEQGFEMGRQLALRLMEMISTGECDDRNYTYVMKPILYDGHSIRKIQKAK